MANLLSYLGVGSPAAFDRHWLSSVAAFRSSRAFQASPKAVAVWLRWGERQASEIEVASFDPQRFREVLQKIRPLTRQEPFMQIFKRVQALCADAGVVILLVPELKGTHLNGATRWLNGKPLIQLSLRHKSDDQFWFTFFHESGHILSGSKRQEFLDPADAEPASPNDIDEFTADAFARDVLLPPPGYESFIQQGDFSAAAVRNFALEQHIAPGIVVGRLQRERKILPQQLQNLKKRINFPSDL